MPDQYGATQFPLPLPIKEQPVGDPFLYYFGSFLQAVGNAKCGAAWSALAPGPSGGPITNVLYLNPQKKPFSSEQLPALFLWRANAKPAHQEAEDIRVRRCTVVALWATPLVPFERMSGGGEADRMPFWESLFSAFDTAIDLGRDPSWIVPGDTYFFPERRGSSLAHWAKYRRLYTMESEPTELQAVAVDPVPGSTLPAYSGAMQSYFLEETLVRDNAARFFRTKGVRGSLISKADPSAPVGTASFEFKTKT